MATIVPERNREISLMTVVMQPWRTSSSEVCRETCKCNKLNHSV